MTVYYHYFVIIDSKLALFLFLIRLHPAAPWERRLTQDVVLSGYQVPSGVSVRVFRWCLELNLRMLCQKCTYTYNQSFNQAINLIE